MRERIDGLIWQWWWSVQVRPQRGQATVEYAIVAAAIAVAALAAVAVLEGGLKGAFEGLVNKLPT